MDLRLLESLCLKSPNIQLISCCVSNVLNKTCERYFTAETPEVDKYCFISKTRSAVNKAAEIRSEKSIAKSCSVSATTVSRIIDEAAQSLHQSPYSALPEHIMMDEFKSFKMFLGK